MGPLTAYRVWFQDETQQRANSWMLMMGAMGMLFSSLPVQYFLPSVGWRGIFLFLALLTLICIFLIIFFIPAWNINRKNIENKNEGSLSEVWNNSFFKSLVPMGFFNYGFWLESINPSCTWLGFCGWCSSSSNFRRVTVKHQSDHYFGDTSCSTVINKCSA